MKTVAPTPTPGAVTSAPAPLAAAPAAATTAKPVTPTPAPVAATSAPTPLPAAAPAAPVLAPVTAAALPPAPLTPASAYAGTRTPLTYERFASQFRIKLEDINHLLKLANPTKYGKFFATDVFGKQYEISGVRAINSFGNNLSNAGADLKYGTADDVKSTDANYKKNSQGVGAEFWANAEIPFSRLTKPEWGTVNGVEEIGRPRGYTGGIDVNTNKKLVEPLNQALANSRLVSNALGAQSGPIPNTDGWNEANMSFGQYFDHGLSFLERSGVRQSIASATPANDPLNAISGGAVGVVGDRGAQFVMNPVTRTLVQVAYFNLITHKPPQPSTLALGRVCNSRPHWQFDPSSLSSQNAC